MSDLEQPQSSGVSRRTVTKAMAWAVPAIAIATPAPAFAASCIPSVTFNNGASCKCPGQSTNLGWGYYLTICVAATCPGQTGTVTIIGIENNSGKPVVPLDGVYPEIGVGGCAALEAYFSESSASKLIITFEYNGATYTTDEIPAPPDCPESGTGNDKVCLPPGTTPPA